MSKAPEVIWRPPQAGRTLMDKYRQHVNAKYQKHFLTTQELHQWTVASPQEFWIDLYQYLKLVPALPKSITVAYDASLPISSVPKWFHGLQMNYAENVLRNAETYPDKIALIGLREGWTIEGHETLTWRKLEEKVCQVSSAMRAKRVRSGDVVAALVSTSIEAVVLFLSTVSLGAVFSSISPDLGVEGCVSRLRQVSPKIIFADGDATFKGRRTSTIPKIQSIIEQLDEKPQIYIIPISDTPLFEDFNQPFTSYYDFLEFANPSESIQYSRVPFNHPLVIVYSSGTTGAPKCIVHQHGLILNLKKVSMLHNSIGPTDIVMQYSSTSWVMFYIMNGHLATGATTICYDGSPMYPDVQQLIRIVSYHKVTYLGTSPRYLYELEKAKVSPQHQFSLSDLRMVNTTGATLSDSQYRWFYNNFPRAVHLSNSAGGTDTATSLIAADPAGPLHIGEMQIRALGMDVDILDAETGNSIINSQRPGEMVIRTPFPSMPAFFWNDDISKPDSLYKSSYFSRFKSVDVWAQHDWLSHNPATNGWIMHGRSDGVLNPSGIRFGSGEIYAIVESAAFSDDIADSLCVGRRRPQDQDEEVFLFLVMARGKQFTAEFESRVKGNIRQALSPRHLPKYIVQVEEVPVTINGKKVETAVKQLISGKEINVSSTVANPKCLLGFKRFRDYEGQKIKIERGTRDSKL